MSRIRIKAWLRTLLIAGTGVAALLLPWAIPTTVTPPSPLSHPIPVFLVDYGRTPSLVLTVDDELMIAYVYGDWNYYALRNQRVIDGIRALLWPTPATLGRKEIAGPPHVDTVRDGIGGDVEEIHTFDVERHAVARLRQRLDRIYMDGLDTAVNAYGMTFVHHPQSYTYWSNSNRMTAAWLESLGCDLSGPALVSYWVVRSQTADH